MSRFLCLALLTIAVAVTFSGPTSSPLSADDADSRPAAGSDGFGEQLPRVPAKSLEESRKAIVLQNGFSAEVVASEPQLRDPVAVAYDERGRMYVVQLPPYNAYIVEGANIGGSIALLEDRDGDGRYETSTVFADDLKYPTAVACWDGGVFVGDAPDLLYMKDTDGDGRADTRKVIFTGFGTDRAGEAHLNSIRWGLDNRFHLSTNLSGGNVKAVADKDAKPVSVRGRGLIFDPRDLTGFELTSGGGQHGLSMDNLGRKFVCSNSVPAQTLMYDDRYVARNPHLEAPAAAVDIAPEGKFTKLYRISPPEPWRVLRTKLRREGQFRGSAEGGKPFGFFTGATGITIYRGDAWPEAYRGNLLVGDVANNLVYRATLEENGVGLIARRADAEADFLASRDIWFRPVQFANAPDGTLHVLDMSRELIEGAAFLPPEFFKHLDALSGNDRGRIYRIVPPGFDKQRKDFIGRADLSNATIAELVALLEHPNGWHRDTASRLLYLKQDAAAIAPLRKLAQTSTFPIGRATALASLSGLNALDEQSLLAGLHDDSAEVRTLAIRLSEQFEGDSPLIRARLAELADDDNLLVRYQLAFSLGSIHGGSPAKPLAELARRDGGDRWMRLAILSSLGRGGDAVFALLAADEKFRQTAAGRKLLAELAAQIGAAGRQSEIGGVLQALSAIPLKEKSLRASIVEGLIAKQTGPQRARILAAAGGEASAILKQLVDDAKRQADDESATVETRVEAIRGLRLARFEEVGELLDGLLQPSQSQPIQSAALETAARFDDPAVATLLLKTWSGLSPALRTRAAETMLSRPAWITAFLNAVEAGDVARSELDPARVQLLRKHPDKQIAARVEKLFANVRLTDRRKVVEAYQPALKLEAKADRGKLVFKKNCSACHKLEDVGTEVGADLKGIAQRGLPSVLLNVLAPNREVKPKFLSYVLVTGDGRILTGMITAENANSVTIRRTDGTSVTVQRIDIEELRSTGTSFMPEGLEKTVTVQDMADLLSYLSSLE